LNTFVDGKGWDFRKNKIYIQYTLDVKVVKNVVTE